MTAISVLIERLQIPPRICSYSNWSRKRKIDFLRLDVKKNGLSGQNQSDNIVSEWYFVLSFSAQASVAVYLRPMVVIEPVPHSVTCRSALCILEAICRIGDSRHREQHREDSP